MTSEQKCRDNCPWPNCRSGGEGRGSFVGMPGRCVDFDHEGAKRRCDMFRRNLPEGHPLRPAALREVAEKLSTLREG